MAGYGFYEALDFTPGRVPEGKTVAVVRAFMAHHQGMSIVAIANAALDGIMRTRFHADPLIEATELLLQERAPARDERPGPTAPCTSVWPRAAMRPPPAGRRLASAQPPTPRTHLLSNGSYAVMLTAAGSGYSRWRDIAVTRWREDADAGRLGLLSSTSATSPAARSGRPVPALWRRRRRVRRRLQRRPCRVLAP